MAHWRNWSGKLTAEPWRLHSLRSESDAVALAVASAAGGRTVRAVGAAHSHMPLIPNDGLIVDVSGLTGVIETDVEAATAEVWAGTPIYALGLPLQEAGLGLANQGDIDRQAISGAVATGTHGTGETLTNLSAMVAGATIATSTGDLVKCDALTEPEVFRAAQLHLGALGLVTRLRLQLVPAYRLSEHGWYEPFVDIQPKMAAYISDNRHFEFFWFPKTDRVHAKIVNQTDAPPEYPVGKEGAKVGWSHEVFPSRREWLHTEMEYSVGADVGEACMLAIRELYQTHFPEVEWAVEYRTVAADDVWLSPANNRPTVAISVHCDIAEDDRRLFGACEEIFLAHDGRPHWAKVNSLAGSDLARHYPDWEKWWEVRDQLDPTGTFLNDYLKSLRT